MIFYFYKITNLINNKYYYGVHSTKNILDGYMGSGKLISQAIKKYGRNNFKKEIIKYFSNEEEMFLYESFIVNKETILDPLCYNLALGGIGCPPKINNSGLKEFWATADTSYRLEHGRKSRAGITEDGKHRQRIKSVGYNNPAFIKMWKPYFSEIESSFLFLTGNTDLPDKTIKKLIVKKYNKQFKMPTMFNYLEDQNKIKIIKKQYYKDVSMLRPVQTIKTNIEILNSINTNFYSIKILNIYFLQKINELLPFLFDKNYSDSYINNNILYGNNFNLKHLFEYAEYIGIFKVGNKFKINIREICPKSQLKFSTKTKIELIESYKDYIFISEEESFNEYELSKHNNGTNVSFMWSRLDEHDRRFKY